METLTGLVLVRRATSGSALTPAGRLLVEWSAGLLARADEVEAAIRSLREDGSRELRVWASMTTAEHLLPRWLVRLRQERRISATLHATNSDAVVAAVRSGGADLGFVETPGRLAGLATRVVGHDELVLVACPEDPWARRRTPVPPATLAARPLTSREPGSGTRLVWEQALAAHDLVTAAPEADLTTTAGVLASVAAGGAPAFVSSRVTGRDVEAGLLVVVPTSGLDLRREFRAVWVGGARPPAGPLRDLLGIASRG